jgi:putative methionine-R-sulfoxide reductase with GAF domain
MGLVPGAGHPSYAGWAQAARRIVTDQKSKPVLDEQTFEKLLEAAYVIQEHSRKVRDVEEKMESRMERLREQAQESATPHSLVSQPASAERSRPDDDYTLTLGEIVEAQRQIQARHLDLDKALAVVAEKVARITGASGAAIGILEEKMVRYRAATGPSALPLGSEVPLASAICAASVRTGQVIRSEDVNTEVLFDPEPCRQREILSLIAVPIYHDGDIVGALEIYFDRIHGYAEQDIHTCRLMAGMVTEVIGRDAESKLKKSIAAERSTMLAAIEKLQPNLAALAEEQSAATPRRDTSVSAVAVAKSPCWKCGNTLVAEEQFCGKCGAPRAIADDEPSGVQSKLASAWQMQTRRDTVAAAPPYQASLPQGTTHPVAPDQANEDEDYLEQDEGGAKLPEPVPLPELELNDPLFAESFNASPDADTMAESLTSESQLNDDEEEKEDAEEKEKEEDNVDAPSAALIRPQQEEEAAVWSSAAKARDFLESLSGSRSPSALARFWRSRRGDFYLAVAVILIVVVIRWGIWSNSVGATAGGTSVSASASRHKQPSPDADLSLFDKLLIGLGLAEAPDETPEYKGNPDTQVWVDLHTALYYCPGTDLYGKTPKGRVSSQRQAQLDQFEPANRKPCD